ncbi:inner membrane complex protein 1f, putative [Babesia caballi]|uniref:Inner membrane complex protein 1f, putative n=1 Tax=Babesia caballi TaxID=5871 RepID=A0AAV4LZS2_BABCB|nr:inner membrane complex protein 1f, putative [Babesia caballi]
MSKTIMTVCLNDQVYRQIAMLQTVARCTRRREDPGTGVKVYLHSSDRSRFQQRQHAKHQTQTLNCILKGIMRRESSKTPMSVMMDDAGTPDTSSTYTTPDEVPECETEKSTLEKSEKAQHSLYECPTAACSIASVSVLQDAEGPLNSDSLENSEDEQVSIHPKGISGRQSNDDNRRLHSLSGEGGSVSFSSLHLARGGYFAGSPGTLLQGTGTLSERPRNLITRSQLRDVAPQRHQATNVRNVMMTPCSVPNTPSAETDVGENSTRVMATESPVRRVEQSPLKARQDTSVTHTNTPISPAVKDYSRAVECGNTSETSFVHEGYDTIQVPRYRPVEIVEKVVEVPVVHHVDTYVPKKEIQEIESFVKKPYTKYVDKIVEVPEVHYSDKVVEVPEYHEITKTVTKVEVQERIKYMPKVEVKIVPKYVEVPVVKVVDRYEEYEEVEEVIKEVEKIEIVEVPREVVKHVVKPVRKIIEQERIVPVVEHRDVPVEKVKFVPKVETVELVREIPKIIDVPVPYDVPKIEYVDQPYIVPEYRDVQVAVPVRKRVTPVYHYQGEPEVIDVPVHKPYFVIHDHITFRPAARPVAEHIKVTGARPIDLSTLSEAERRDAEERMKKALEQRTLGSTAQGDSVSTQTPVQHSPTASPQATGMYHYVPNQRDPPVTPGQGQVEVPVSASRPLHGPQFGLPTSPSSNRTKLSMPLESIVYRSSPKNCVSPVSDGGATDVYPQSNNTTPRMGRL